MNSKYVKIGLLSAAWMIPSTLQGQVAGGINTYPPQNAGVSERGEALKQDPEIIKRYFPQMMGAAASSAQPKPAPETFSISFPGGSAAQFVEYLRKVSKNAPNIMLAPSMQDAEVPAFDLRNITVEDLFQALNSMQGGGKSGFWQMSGSDHPIWVLNPPKAAPVAPPFLMTVPVEKNNVPAEKRRTMVFPLAQHLATFSIEDITTAVETAWEMSGANPQWEMKFHKDTKLLIVVGTNEQLETVMQVLKALERNQIVQTNE